MSIFIYLFIPEYVIACSTLISDAVRVWQEFR